MTDTPSLLTAEQLAEIRENLTGIKERARYGQTYIPKLANSLEYSKRGDAMVRDMDLMLSHIAAQQQIIERQRKYLEREVGRAHELATLSKRTAAKYRHEGIADALEEALDNLNSISHSDTPVVEDGEAVQ